MSRAHPQSNSGQCGETLVHGHQAEEQQAHDQVGRHDAAEHHSAVFPEMLVQIDPLVMAFG